MKKDKRTKIILLSILILFLSVSVASSVFAYGGDPADPTASDSYIPPTKPKKGDKSSVSGMNESIQPTGIIVGTNSNFTNAWTAEELNLFLNSQDIADAEDKIRHAEAELGSWEVVTRAGDVASVGAQYGPMVYVLIATGEFAMVPIAVAWQGGKHGGRLLYGAVTGNWDTIRRVNDRSFTGQLVNRFTRLDGSDGRQSGLVYDAQRPGPRGSGIK